jgi:hypothetical protein
MSDETDDILRHMAEVGLVIVWHHRTPLGSMKVDFAELQTPDGKSVDRRAVPFKAPATVPINQLKEMLAAKLVQQVGSKIIDGRSYFELTAASEKRAKTR